MEQFEDVLKQQFGYEAFLPGQREIITEALSGRDTFVLMPTGAGKSLIYQFSALLLPGITIVVSPLIALMQDQVDRLHANGIAATFINSSLNPQERSTREREMLQGKFKLVYVAPERLLTRTFLSLLDEAHKRYGLSLLAIDEAHCVSEWGHDFRPEYRQLGPLRERYPQTPLMALTATATEHVRDDILTQLRLRDPYVHIASFNRPNLYYEVRQKHQGSYAELLQVVREQAGAPVIIYCQSRKSVETLSASLQLDGIAALPYHAGLTNEQRTENQNTFIRDDVPVLVATIAFGMGIAKPDVRAVIHYDMPKSLEGYYQESGRAGRDGQPALCLLFFQYGDRTKFEFVFAQKTEEQYALARQQLQEVITYSERTTCRRRALLEYFGETLPSENCGNCDNCLRPVGVLEDRTIDAQKFLSCVSRTKQRFGMRHIVDILRGANTQRIRDFGHNQLTTYGIGRDLSTEEWLRFGRALLQQGLLSESKDGYPILQLNKLSVEVLKKERSVEVISAPVRHVKEEQQHEAAKSASPLAAPLNAQEQELFHQLRSLRKHLADERGVPPYTVFPDSSLQAMALYRPQSEGAFGRIPGVGRTKREAYFVPFSDLIREYCEQHHLEMDRQPPEEEKKARKSETSTPKTSPGPSTQQVTLAMFKEGRSIDEIAQERHVKASTVIGHLSELIEGGEDVDVEGLIQPGHYDLIVNAFRQTESEFLKPVKELLGDDFSYEEIRLARALMKRTQE